MKVTEAISRTRKALALSFDIMSHPPERNAIEISQFLLNRANTFKAAVKQTQP
jgi:hypothetical protein